MFKINLHLTLAAALLATSMTVAFAQSPTPLITKTEDQWIEVLKKSDASQKDKVDACRQLSVIGTAKSIPILAGMLGDEKMNHMARFALEPNPDPSVNKVFRDALGQLHGLPLVGVITSIGVRRDVAATDELGKLAASQDVFVSEAAAHSLGRIGTSAAAKALDAAASSVPAKQLWAIYEGELRCAENLAATGEKDEAIAIYDKLRVLEKPQQVRAAGLRGALIVREKEGLSLLAESLRSDDWVLADAAARAAIEMKVHDVTLVVAGELAKASPDRQILLAKILGKRADANGLPALYELAKSGDSAARVAAIHAIPQIQNSKSAPILADLIGNADKDVSNAAQQALGGLPGADVDALIVKMLSTGDPAHRLAAAQLTGRRHMVSAVADLVKAGADPDANVRACAISRVGELASPNELSGIVGLLATRTAPEDLDVVAQALSAIITRSANPEAYADILLVQRVNLKQPAQQGALMRVLSSVGGQKAMAVLRDGVKNPDKTIHAAAVSSLAEWKTTEATPDLLQIVKTTEAPAERTQAYVNYLRLCNEAEPQPAQRLKLIMEIAGQAKSSQEKVLLISALGGVPTVDAMKTTASYLADPQFADEAALAILRITSKLDQSNKADIAPVLNQVLKSTKNAKAVEDARGQMKKLGITEQ